MNAVSTLGIDLAKNTFSVHGVDVQTLAGKALLGIGSRGGQHSRGGLDEGAVDVAVVEVHAAEDDVRTGDCPERYAESYGTRAFEQPKSRVLELDELCAVFR
jgi:hypothetical protein